MLHYEAIKSSCWLDVAEVVGDREFADYSGSSDLGICGDIERMDGRRGALEWRLGIGNVTASISEVCDGEDLARGVCG